MDTPPAAAWRVRVSVRVRVRVRPDGCDLHCYCAHDRRSSKCYELAVLCCIWSCASGLVELPGVEDGKEIGGRSTSANGNGGQRSQQHVVARKPMHERGSLVVHSKHGHLRVMRRRERLFESDKDNGGRGVGCRK